MLTANIHSKTKLLKTFLVGVVTPPISIFCTFSRQNRPNWMTQEFMYTASRARNACYAFGLVCGLGIITGGAALGASIIIDECLSTPTSSDINKIAPRNEKRILVPMDRRDMA